MKQGMNQRAAIMSMTGMHDHAGGFVEHYQELVFIQDVQVNRFWMEGECFRLILVQNIALALMDPV
jgi:hypothetical protein